MVEHITDESTVYTYKEFKNLPDDGHRYELHNGQIYMMADASEYHFDIQREILRQFSNFLDGKTCKVYSERSVRLRYQKDESDQFTYKPDICVVCDKSKTHNYFVAGAPDLIIEIGSPNTGSVDLLEKRHAYQEFGVKEYWIVKDVRTVYQYIPDEQGIYRETPYVSFHGEDIEIPVKIWDGRFAVKLGQFVHEIGGENP